MIIGIFKKDRFKKDCEIKFTGVWDEYALLEEYVAWNVKIKFKHSICGHEFMMNQMILLMDIDVQNVLTLKELENHL